MDTKDRHVERELLREVASELGLPLALVRDVVMNGQFGFVAHVIKSGSYQSVRIPYIGTFTLKKRYLFDQEHMKGMEPVFREYYKEWLRRKGYLKQNKDEQG